jgi:hypothetical protein
MDDFNKQGMSAARRCAESILRKVVDEFSPRREQEKQHEAMAAKTAKAKASSKITRLRAGGFFTPLPEFLREAWAGLAERANTRRQSSGAAVGSADNRFSPTPIGLRTRGPFQCPLPLPLPWQDRQRRACPLPTPMTCPRAKTSIAISLASQESNDLKKSRSG